MDLKVTNNIDNNIFSTSITVDAFGSEQLSEDEEKELLVNFPVKLAYRNLKFTKNIKMEGSVPVITEDEPDEEDEETGKNIVTVTLPALSNKEIPIDENFNAYYKVDYTRIPPSAVDNNVLTTKELVSHAYCLIFAQVVCDAVRDIMAEVRKKAPAFEGETIVSV